MWIFLFIGFLLLVLFIYCAIEEHNEKITYDRLKNHPYNVEMNCTDTK